jgi:uncharacterized protein (TIGR03118 family)
MKIPSSTKGLVLAAVCSAGLTSGGSAAGLAGTWTNLNSSIYGVSDRHDDKLDDPWGVAPGATGTTVWVANELTGTVTRYDLNGKPYDIGSSPEVVTVPPAPGSAAGTVGTPTGLVFDHLAFKTGNMEFPITVGTSTVPSTWLSVTLDGNIVGFNTNVTQTTATPSAVIGATVAGAYFTGCTIAEGGTAAAGTAGTSHQLFATDFAKGVVDVFNTNWTQATLATGAFTDSSIPTGFKPYNIKRYATKDPLTNKFYRVLLVAYAEDSGTLNGNIHVLTTGNGTGYIDVFDTSGNLLERLANPSTSSPAFDIDAPWGMAIYRKNGKQANDEVIVANHGSGVLLTYSLKGVFNPLLSLTVPVPQDGPSGILERADGEGPLRFELLRGVHFGAPVESTTTAFSNDEDELGTTGSDPLYFDADLAFDERGLFGRMNLE